MNFQSKVILSFIFGTIAGRYVKAPNEVDLLIQMLLALLLFLIGVDSGYSISYKDVVSGLKTGLLSLMSAVAGSFAAGVLFFPMLGKLSIASALGLGWYTFSSSFLASQMGSMGGVIGFVTNLSREIFGMITIPSLSRKFSCGALVSMAGSPSSDTLLPFIYKQCGSSSLVPSIAQGVLTTFVVPLLQTAAISAL
ncbi:MAG: lysine exporter LysO family protein [Fervidicoccaceae archaeon]